MTDWPDWTGDAVAIIASGPSVRRADVDLLKSRLRVLAIKKNVELAPWADAVYGCDFPWWRSVRGLPDYKGRKFAYAPQACDQFGCQKVEVDIKADALLTGKAGLVGSGGNSGFQAMNLAVQWGVNRILTLGFDCQDRSGVHWYGRNMAQGMSNPSETNFRRWRAAFHVASGQLEALGVEVINASPLSDIKSFKRAGIAETLERWGL